MTATLRKKYANQIAGDYFVTYGWLNETEEGIVAQLDLTPVFTWDSDSSWYRNLTNAHFRPTESAVVAALITGELRTEPGRKRGDAP